MGVEGRYPEFKTLNRDVIKPSIEEINEKTEIFIEPVLKKHGREVLAIQFIVEENTSYDGPPMPPLLGPNLDDETISERLATYEALLSFGIDRGAAVSLLDQYDDQYIFDNLYVVSERIRNGKTKVQRPAAYAVNAIKQDYRPPDVDYDAISSLSTQPEKKASKEDVDKQKVKAAREKLAEFKNTQFPAWRFRKWEGSVTSNDYQETWNRFRDEVLNTTPMLMKRYSGDPESPMVSAHFRTFVRSAILSEPTRDDEVACAHDLGVPLADWVERAKFDE